MCAGEQDDPRPSAKVAFPQVNAEDDMNIVVWALAGAALGWITFSYFKLSEGRGMAVSLIVGAVGGLAGGHLIAPLLGLAASVPDSFSAVPLLVALASAGALLFIGDRIYERFGM
jgi:uncharacterized membrane protein YeaQ/YmgE (transglycosylase-associated protein family)